MKRINTIIIGAGQAGLAMSRCLSERSVAHVVIERGEAAHSWSTERWDSLRLLTPNWQSRLPGYSYSGAKPEAYMSMHDITDYLQQYATLITAPVETNTRVISVDCDSFGYRVITDRGDFLGRNVVLATGACNIAQVPASSEGLPSHISQLTPLQYRNPAQLDKGGVLVVGASASGVQLATEIRNAGHEVTLCVGQHIRMPRHYRGRDIQWWMERTGVHDTTIDQVDDIERARRVPSLQLSGSLSTPLMDLNFLQSLDVKLTGRLQTIRDGKALFSGSLANQCALSDLKMNRLLAEFDAWAEEHETETGTTESDTSPNTGDVMKGANTSQLQPAYRVEDTRYPTIPTLQIDLADGQIRTVLWATGFRPDFSYVQLPVFDRKARLQHNAGLVAPGLYVLGLPFLRRRNSALIDGVGKDAQALADHLVGRREQHAA